MSKTRMPVTFIAHGSPMNAIEDNASVRGWKALADKLPRPKAIVCISAHWETQGVFATATRQPETIHDFGQGLPQALFDMQYNPPGSPQLAKRLAELIKKAPVILDHSRGLDHGVWSVLVKMYPDADIPVVQLSLDMRQPAAFHYQLAKELAPLRDEDVLIIASGLIVHNLRLYSLNDNTPPFDWAARFNDQVRELIKAGKHQELIDYQALGKDAELSIPTPEHYLPLLYVLGLQEKNDTVSFFNDTVSSSISMLSCVVGT